MPKPPKALGIAQGQCLCGSVGFEIDVPARWAWHDHSIASRRAHGAAYATYVGSWRKRFRITKGETWIAASTTRPRKPPAAFASVCTPLIYERVRSPHMVNIPRALFAGRTGRQTLYHVAIEELQEWTYAGEPLVPLKGFPGVVWQRSKKKRRGDRDGMFLIAQGSHERASLHHAFKLIMMPRPRRQRSAGRRRHEKIASPAARRSSHC